MRAARPEAAPRPVASRPLYARLLRLRHVAPSGFLCFVFLEGAVALGILLALAELVSWWGVLVLPLTVAAMVKLNDTIAGALSRSAAPAAAGFPRAQSLRPATATGPTGLGTLGATASRATPPSDLAGQATTRLPGVISRDQGPPIMRPWAEEAEAHQQRVRQSARGRYE
ncbi:hypothetical protein BJ973_005809 [Actinoplanes tereljensis]|uniref:Uncharacterized protein n=1 Tax=Paractinoplanes tereljensis TaxID=571912 RepID=A0A919TYR2_9ACTN|nr:hypothetical protein [Actinoplanes tereljensis]GIF26449.1 hypothetical protein Ate02nite_91790 [Actinoplanes tereljensis]